jgi:hypothetical protein
MAEVPFLPVSVMDQEVQIRPSATGAKGLDPIPTALDVAILERLFPGKGKAESDQHESASSRSDKMIRTQLRRGGERRGLQLLMKRRAQERPDFASEGLPGGGE